jgi:hypothetical protein
VKYPTGLISNNTSDSGLGKIDYHINDKNSLSGTYFNGRETGVFAASSLVRAMATALRKRQQTVNSQWLH